MNYLAAYRRHRNGYLFLAVCTLRPQRLAPYDRAKAPHHGFANDRLTKRTKQFLPADRSPSAVSLPWRKLVPFKMTRRNWINMVSIVALSAWAIFAFPLTKTQCVGLFLVLALAPKLFWSSFDYIARGDLNQIAAWFRAAPSSQPREGKTEIKVAS